MNEKVDFFISYTATDTDWAVWVAWQLEEAGYSTVLQAWDFNPGSNFVIEMHNACSKAEKTIAVFSEDYLKSAYGTPEWSSAFVNDPMGLDKKLVPVKIGPCEPTGLLKSIVWIDLIGLSDEEAKKKLLDGIKSERMKPHKPPAYPGLHEHKQKPVFPPSEQRELTTQLYVPKIPKEKTDLQINDYIMTTYKVIRQYFIDASAELQRQSPNIDIRLNDIQDNKFTCEVFVHGKSRAACKVWVNKQSYSHPQIGYAEGQFSINQDGSFQEILSVNNDLYSWGLQATLRSLYGKDIPEFDFDNLTAEKSAEYLWFKFASILESSLRYL